MTLQKLLEENDFISRSYSGRGMYGAECLAVSVQDRDTAYWDIAVLITTYNNSEEVLEGFEDALNVKSPSWDSLGHNYILYWPDIVFES